MLAIEYKSSFSYKKLVLVLLVLIALCVGLYATSLFMSPAIAHSFFVKPIVVSTLPKPIEDDNRLVVPKLGINIPYSTNSSSLVQSAQWRQTELGNPLDGGTMLLVAHHLNVQITPQQTVTRSPFYALDTLANGDRLIIDYKGIRYGYEITSVITGAVSATTIPTDTSTSRLVLSTYDSTDDATRTVVTARPLGKVAL